MASDEVPKPSAGTRLHFTTEVGPRVEVTTVFVVEPSAVPALQAGTVQIAGSAGDVRIDGTNRADVEMFVCSDGKITLFDRNFDQLAGPWRVLSLQID